MPPNLMAAIAMSDDIEIDPQAEMTIVSKLSPHRREEVDSESTSPPPIHRRSSPPSRPQPERCHHRPRQAETPSPRSGASPVSSPRRVRTVSDDAEQQSFHDDGRFPSPHAQESPNATNHASLAEHQPPQDNDQNNGEAESIALARMLMEQEAIESYGALSADFLRYNSNQFSQEDLQALQAALAEDDSEGEGEGEPNLDYDMMLRIGESIGDVKKERWHLVAQSQIEKLDEFQFDPKTASGKDENDCEVKCLVCQFSYEAQESLRRLPCGHCFHGECVEQWLKDNDICPYCRQTIEVP